MKSSLLIISGWAHGPDSIRPIGNALSEQFEIQLLSGAQVLREKNLPSAEVIITGSMGGLLAIEHLPATCKKLVIISSTAKFCADTSYRCGTSVKILQRMMTQLKCNPDAVLNEFYQNVHHHHPSLKTDPGCSHEELIAGLEYLQQSDLRDRIQDVHIPTLLLHGAQDRIIPPTASEWLHAHLPDSQLRIFETGGHALPAHQFDEVMDTIAQFL